MRECSPRNSSTQVDRYLCAMEERSLAERVVARMYENDPFSL